MQLLSDAIPRVSCLSSLDVSGVFPFMPGEERAAGLIFARLVSGVRCVRRVDNVLNDANLPALLSAITPAQALQVTSLNLHGMRLPVNLRSLSA